MEPLEIIRTIIYYKAVANQNNLSTRPSLLASRASFSLAMLFRAFNVVFPLALLVASPSNNHPLLTSELQGICGEYGGNCRTVGRLILASISSEYESLVRILSMYMLILEYCLLISIRSRPDPFPNILPKAGRIKIRGWGHSRWDFS